MRLPPFLCTSALVFAVGVAQAEPPGRLPARLVRTSLDGPPRVEPPLPPRLITGSLDPRNVEVLGGEIAPRAVRRDLSEEAESSLNAPSAVEPPIADVRSGATAEDAAGWVEAGAPSGVSESPAEVTAPEPTLDPTLGTLECDCTRSGRKIRLTLDASTPVPRQSARIIRVEL